MATPVRNSHTSTADLLTWSDVPPPSSPNSSATASRNAPRSRQPSDGMSKVFGGQITDEEAESLYKRKPCSGYKLKEMSGSNIFSAGGKEGVSESVTVNGNFTNRTSIRIVQQAGNGTSQISFATEERVSPRKPTTPTEVAKQRELSGTLASGSDSKVKKQPSDAKSKELSGNDIFGPPPEVPPRSLAAARSPEPKESKHMNEPTPRAVHTSVKDMNEPAPRAVRTSVKVSNPAGGQSNIFFGDEPVVNKVGNIHNQKFAELIGNDIFSSDATPGSPEKPLSSAKLREMRGNDIFSDGKVESREHFGGVRKPPGGESSIRLV